MLRRAQWWLSSATSAKASPSSGMMWFFKTDKGRYMQLLPSAENELEMAKAAGMATLTSKLGTKAEYTVDFNAMTQTNVRTGAVRELKRSKAHPLVFGIKAPMGKAIRDKAAASASATKSTAGRRSRKTSAAKTPKPPRPPKPVKPKKVVPPARLVGYAGRVARESVAKNDLGSDAANALTFALVAQQLLAEAKPARVSQATLDDIAASVKAAAGGDANVAAWAVAQRLRRLLKQKQ